MKCLAWLLSAMLGIFVLSACDSRQKAAVDELNELSYDFHYRSLDSTRIYAEQALAMASGYSAGRAEALNNLAFYCISRMDYDRAYMLLDSIETDNLVELLIADVQRMRLCQRESKNKLFYDYSLRAQRRLHRIKEELSRLDDHQCKRMVYAESEFYIVQSTYFYYVGLTDQSTEAILNVESQLNDGGELEIESDTAQLLNYLYNVGSGGIIHEQTQDAIADAEFAYLVRCYQLALAHGYPFFEAQALQGMSEHLENVDFLNSFVANNAPALALVNPANMPDTLLAGYLAQRALDLFSTYGDVYQTAGAYRTLAECFWGIGDYQSAEICLLNALEKDTVINRAPDLVASIREQLSLVYSAIDDKARSDHNRNIYLDLQEQTRQDRQLEARYDQLQHSSRQLNVMLMAVVLMIGLLLVLLYLFHRMRQRKHRDFSIVSLLEPLEEWKRASTEKTRQLEEQGEELREQTELMSQQVLQNKKRNLEQRAKVSLAYSIMPFIDRIVNEVQRLRKGAAQRQERYAYVAELTGRINDYNDVLTRWIQMRQGDISLRIESFSLQELFNLVKRGRMSYKMKGIDLVVEDTTNVVKADKTLTLFMINTMADNARKFTHEGGRVTIASEARDGYVEVSISDTGIGLSPDEQKNIFNGQPMPTGAQHGFGLRNCKGIIEKYRKLSKIFSVCEIGVESERGRGSRFFFRLPLGRGMVVALLMMLSLGCSAPAFAELLYGDRIAGSVHIDPRKDAARHALQAGGPTDSIASAQSPLMKLAERYADSAYFANINAHYAATLAYADSCRNCLNQYYRQLKPNGDVLMLAYSANADLPPELQWYKEGLPFNYGVIQSMRNEAAVAALALHKWDIYNYNNKVYTRLFRELSADDNLASYCRTMQKSETNKNVAVVLLVLLLLSIFPAYYLLYYRHLLSYRYSVERVGGINKILLSHESPDVKLRQINELWSRKAEIDDGEHAALNAVVSQIKEALQSAIDLESVQHTSIDLARDELRRVTYENDRLHISNNVLDNCLSTLKHETMYFPSRILQLADGSDDNLEALGELTTYYKDLYSMLLLQATRAAEGTARIDRDLFSYVLDILRKHGGDGVEVHEAPHDDRYMRLSMSMSGLTLSRQQTDQLFTAFTIDPDFLLCRQLMRDLGEAANARGCGIQAMLPNAEESGHPVIEITLTKQIWKLLK